MSRERLVAPQGGGEEKDFNWGLRPKNLSEYTGQRETVDRLKIAIDASKLRGEPLDHLLLHGPPGLGKCITPDSFISTQNGLVPFESLIPRGMKAGESRSIRTKIVGLDGIEAASQIYCSGLVPTLKITTGAGFVLEGTPHHPVLVASASGPIWKRLDELTPQDRVAVGRGMGVFGQSRRAVLKRETAAFARQRSMNAVCGAHAQLSESLGRPPAMVELRRAYCAARGISDTPTPSRVANRLGLPLSDGRNIATVQAVSTAPFALFALSSAEKLERIVELGADAAYLIGAATGDGNMMRGAAAPGFVITCDEPAMQDELRRVSQKLFGFAPDVYHSKARAARLSFCASVGAVMREFGLTDAGAWTKTVPQGVLSGSREAVVGFLQGLFDADGHARADGFELATRSWKLAQGVQLLLANLGIIGRLNSKFVVEQPMWTLWIGGENAAKFHQEVGFRLERKQAVWSQNLTPRGWCISELVPNANALLVALLNRSAPHSREVHRAFDHAKRDDRTPTRRGVEKMLSLLPETARDEPEFATLCALCDERFFWDAVSSVEASENEAYDFVVPGSHSFLANGIYNHNTTLAYIIAEELGRDIALTSGPSLERPGDVMGFLVNAKEGDIIFIDEIHRLPRIVEEFLYSAMEDYIVNFTLDKGMYSKPLPIRLEKFTIIGATTRPAMLTRPLRDRFGLQQHFDFYTDDDLVSIVRRSAHILGTPTDAEAAREIARRSRGTPRIANRLLRRVRDFAQVRADGDINPQIARDGMKLEGIDELGLDRLDHAMMNVIKDVYEGGPVGIEALAATLNEESDTLVDVVEPYLLKIGFLARTPAGRRITKRAYEHLGALPPATAMTPQLTLIEEAVEADERLREIKRKRNGDEK